MKGPSFARMDSITPIAATLALQTVPDLIAARAAIVWRLLHEQLRVTSTRQTSTILRLAARILGSVRGMPAASKSPPPTRALLLPMSCKPSVPNIKPLNHHFQRLGKNGANLLAPACSPNWPHYGQQAHSARCAVKSFSRNSSGIPCRAC